MSIYLVYPLNKIDGLLIVMGGLSIFALRYGYEWKYRNIMFFSPVDGVELKNNV